jgi:hypothetical protein
VAIGKQEDFAMENLLSVIAIWLSINFGLPADGPHPHIKIVEPSKMTLLWLEQAGTASRVWQDENVGVDIQAFYVDRQQTIFLSDDWNPKKPKDVSVLIHEMVHHLQNLDKQAFPCPADRERLAYKAQALWLVLFQTSFDVEFEIDELTVKLRTRCMH